MRAPKPLRTLGRRCLGFLRLPTSSLGLAVVALGVCAVIFLSRNVLSVDDTEASIGKAAGQPDGEGGAGETDSSSSAPTSFSSAFLRQPARRESAQASKDAPHKFAKPPPSTHRDSTAATSHPPAARHRDSLAGGSPHSHHGKAAASESYPSEWLSRHSVEELSASEKNASRWAETVKEAMRWNWGNIRRRALGDDNFEPSTGRGKNWCKLGLNLVDALDTLYLMDLKVEFDEAERWVNTSMNIAGSMDTWQSFFEITIRILGGLLGAHAVSSRRVFLDRARELGDSLLGAWTASGSGEYPVGEVNVRRSQGRRIHWMGERVGTAEIGTCQLEFRYLSHLTGDSKYAEAVDKAWGLIFRTSVGKGLLPIYYTGRGPSGNEISFGARGDSYYEYLIKGFIQTELSEDVLYDKWKLAMDEMFKHLIFKSSDGHIYVAKQHGGRAVHEFDHLACFVPGMLIKAAEVVPKGILTEDERQRYRHTAEGITETCHVMYATKSGLAPEIVVFPNQGAMQTKSADAFSLLRPEAAEAMFYMHYYTGDPKYRMWANEIMVAMNAKARAAYGFSAVDQVNSPSPRMRNNIESFFFAETLKYLYLIQMPRSKLDLTRYVFNTEAHPMGIWKPSSRARFAAH